MLASWNYCKVHDIVYTPSTQPCPVCLQEENTKLKDLLGELYDEAAYEWAGEWVIENKDLQKKIKQIFKDYMVLRCCISAEEDANEVKES